MFNFFKKKCPVCKMALAKGKEYPQEYGQSFCSEHCRDTYRARVATEAPPEAHNCCQQK